MGHVSIFETMHEVLYVLHMVLLPFEDAPTQVRANVRFRVRMCHSRAEQLLNDLI